MPVNTKTFAPQTLPQATRKNELWVVDFVLRDDSQRTPILIIFDAFSKLPVGLAVLNPAARRAEQFAGHLDEATRGERYPATLWVDAGFEFKSPELKEWTTRHGVETVYGAPTQQRRSITERFLRRLTSFLSENASLPPDHLNRNLAEWRQHYKVTAE